MNKTLMYFCRIMLALARFEAAITPKYAGHYMQRKLDIQHWESEYHKKQLQCMK
jgi:hypothetical protein